MARSPGSSVPPDPAEAVSRIALQVGATPMAHVDVATMLSGVCTALPAAVGVAGAALVLTEPADPRDPAARAVFASDEVAGRLGLIQHRAGRGPVPAAVRGNRPLVVPDLTVSGPPELAAAAADCGLVRSLVVPVPGAVGLQLLAGADTALDESTTEVLRPLVAALSARLADVREIARLRLDAERAARAADIAAEQAAGTAAAPGSDGPPPERADRPGTPIDAGTVAPAATGPVPDGSRLGDGPPEPPADENAPAETDLAAATQDPSAGDPTGGTPTEGDPNTRYPDADAATGATVDQATLRLNAVSEDADDAPPANGLFATGEPGADTPPIGQAELGWEGPEDAPAPLPVRPLPARIRVVGRPPRPTPVPRTAREAAAVPAQRSGPVDRRAVDVEHMAVTPADPGTVADDPDDPDEPTRRVPRHRLREDG